MKDLLPTAAIIGTVRAFFSSIPDSRSDLKAIPLVDFFMSGIAIFGLKIPSLLQFDKGRTDEAIKDNLNNLYGIKEAPSDTHLRTVLDEIDPLKYLGNSFQQIIAMAERKELLEDYQYINEYTLCSVDGTGHFYSKNIYCEHCCTKKTRNGEIIYNHQAMAAVLVHPNKKEVLPLSTEAILKQDGDAKNDCELNASKRLVPRLKKLYPSMKLILVHDSLFANGPYINLLAMHDYSYIISVKSNSKHLFSQVNSRKQESLVNDFDLTDEDGIQHRFQYTNGVSLNKSHPDLLVNFIEYWEIGTKKTQHFVWITDIEINDNNVFMLMKGGRSRWKIENETFNTLKNQGYHFEHNYGHGKKHLISVLLIMMMLAFLIDQVQELANESFQKGMIKCETRRKFWDKLGCIFKYFHIKDWDTLFLSIIGLVPQEPILIHPQGP